MLKSRSNSSPGSSAFDLLDIPILGRFLRWRHSRVVLQIPLLILSVAMVLHGLFGPDLAQKNLATTLTWVHFRGLLVFVLLFAGNFFCLACPLVLVRDAARRLIHPRFSWPRSLRNKWLPAGLFVLLLFSYERFSLWSSAWWTAWLIIAYFAGALVVDCLFKHASFCKFVCPIGQFNFVSSLISPLEVKMRDQRVCSSCKTRDCIRGRREPATQLVVIRGCELALFQPLKAGNMDCTFCLDCLHACPHDNVGISSRLPASELTEDVPRSGIGLFSRRKDIAGLAIVFTYGALLNAFAMLSPFHELVNRWASALHRNYIDAALALVFTLFLLAAPAMLLGLAALLAKAWNESGRGLWPLGVRYSYALVPMGFGMWLAHYSFHFLTGLFTPIPLIQSAAASVGLGLFGEPRWSLTGLPIGVVSPLQIGFLSLGLIGSLLVAYRLAEEDAPVHPTKAFFPWAAVCVLLWTGSLWLISQPMDMRGTFMSG